MAAAWAIRRRTRAPLAALLFFGGTLFPVLGFFNLLTFLYSLVADHYQYLASLGIVALVSAVAVKGWQHLTDWISDRGAFLRQGQQNGASSRTMHWLLGRLAGAAV